MVKSSWVRIRPDTIKIYALQNDRPAIQRSQADMRGGCFLFRQVCDTQTSKFNRVTDGVIAENFTKHDTIFDFLPKIKMPRNH